MSHISPHREFAFLIGTWSILCALSALSCSSEAVIGTLTRSESSPPAFPTEQADGDSAQPPKALGGQNGEVTPEDIAAFAEAPEILSPETSDRSWFMLGSVVGILVMPDSQGCPACGSTTAPCCFDWSPEEVAEVKKAFSDAMAWWQELARRRNVPLTLHAHFADDGRPGMSPRIATQYEAVNHVGPRAHDWVNDVMTHLGVQPQGATNQRQEAFLRQAAYVDRIREQYKADFGFVVYVADQDGLRVRWGRDEGNGTSAWAEHMRNQTFVTYQKAQDAYSTIAHEVGHVFGAWDENTSWPCTHEWGYLTIPNRNSMQPGSEGCAPRIERSIMRYRSETLYPHDRGDDLAIYALDRWAAGQIGWWDEDENGIQDPLDVDVQTELQCEQARGRRRIRAVTRVKPVPGLYGIGFTINQLEDVSYRLPGGDWQDPVVHETQKGLEQYFVVETSAETGSMDVQAKTQYTPFVTKQVNLDALCDPS